MRRPPTIIEPRNGHGIVEGIPSVAEVHLKILEAVSDGRMHKIAEVTDSVAERLDVTDEARKRVGKAGRRLFDMNVKRATHNLRAAGLIKNGDIGIFEMTREGRAVLSARPTRIDAGYLRRNCKQYRIHEERLAKNRKNLRSAGTAGGPRRRRGMVAIIDVLGVKGSWRDENGAGVPSLHKRWNSLLKSTKCLLKGDDFVGKSMTFSAFSDTMFITVEGQSYDRVLLAFGGIMWQAIIHSIKEDVPVRGCVSCGDYFRSGDNLFTGPAVDEAAAYYSLPQWIGISAAPSANSALSRAIPRPSHRNNRIYRRHDIPLKMSVEQDAWALNWPRQSDDEDEEWTIEEIIEHIDDRMDRTTDIGAALKWRNTRKFCNAVLSA